MRNGFLKSFLALFIVLNLIFFESIIGWIYSLSDIFWALADFDLFCVVWAVVIVAFIVVFLVYFFKHREKEEIVKVVEFKCPDDMSPLELGFLIDGVVDNEDLSSLLVYWASKKYIEISNEKKNQKITKLVEKLPDESKEYEKKMFQTIFLKDKEVLVDKIPDGLKNGNNVVIKNAIKTVEKDIGDKYFDKKAMWYKQILICATALLYCIAVMYLVLSDYQIGVGYIGSVFAVVSTVLYILVADWFLKYYDYRHKNNSSKGKVVSLVFFVLLIAGIIAGWCYFLQFWAYQIVFMACIVAVMFLVPFMLKKIKIYTDEGRKKLGQVLGFKDYLVAVEKDKMKMLVEENPSVYYDVLPYAYALGVSDKWIEKLNVISAENPDLVNQNMLSNLAVCTILFANTRLVFISVIRFAVIIKLLGGLLVTGLDGARRR